jgi:rhamnulokinase
MAIKAKPFNCFINPDDYLFHNPPNMVKAIQQYCDESDQTSPKTIGEISRTIFEGLAFRYRQIVQSIEMITEKKIEVLFIIGGGSSNQLLNQFTANSLNIPVKAGSIEATSIGNILMQAKAVGQLNTLEELRQCVIQSFPLSNYYPEDINNWENAYADYLKYTN